MTKVLRAVTRANAWSRQYLCRAVGHRWRYEHAVKYSESTPAWALAHCTRCGARQNMRLS